MGFRRTYLRTRPCSHCSAERSADPAAAEPVHLSAGPAVEYRSFRTPVLHKLKDGGFLLLLHRHTLLAAAERHSHLELYRTRSELHTFLAAVEQAVAGSVAGLAAAAAAVDQLEDQHLRRPLRTQNSKEPEDVHSPARKQMPCGCEAHRRGCAASGGKGCSSHRSRRNPSCWAGMAAAAVELLVEVQLAELEAVADLGQHRRLKLRQAWK